MGAGAYRFILSEFILGPRNLFLIGLLALAAVSAEPQKKLVPLQHVSNSANKFSANFLKEIASENKNGNLVSSPLSAHLVLSMAAYGAREFTSQQMKKALRLPKKDAVAHEGFENLVNNFKSMNDVTLRIANKIYIVDTLDVFEDYKKIIKDTFHSEIASMDVTKPKETAKNMNDWVASQTNGKITELVDENDIVSTSRMMLLNAIYFKGAWANQFDPIFTKSETFHLGNKNVVEVPMMKSNIPALYGELPDLKAKFIELPYENRDVVMVVIIPDEVEGLAEIENNLKSFNHTRLMAAREMKTVEASLPKFKIQSTIDLDEVLKRLGMTQMFTNYANFKGISDEFLKVDKVLQKAFIEVDEKGSEAAAATQAQIGGRSGRFPMFEVVSFVVDRPFYYMIKAADVTLFQGHVVNPLL